MAPLIPLLDSRVWRCATATKPSMQQRRRRLLVLTLLPLAAYALLTMLQSRRRLPAMRADAAALSTRSGSTRAAELASALRVWGRVPPAAAIVAAAGCRARDAAEAILRVVIEEEEREEGGGGGGGGEGWGVVDVGANKGYPVTQMALQADGVAWVLAVEPHEGAFERLRMAPVAGAARFEAVRAAAVARKGLVTMQFSTERDDVGCVGCMNALRDDVREEEVPGYTVDELAEKLGEQRVALVRTSTRGPEVGVLQGARDVLARAEYAVVQFDPRFLRADSAAQLVQMLSGVGGCVHMLFPNVPMQQRTGDEMFVFGEPIDVRNAVRFYEWVRDKGLYTNLLCKMTVQRVDRAAA